MTIHQLSVFIENKKGALLQVFEILKSAGIQLISTTIADTEEYGILRILCSEPSKAYRVLKKAGMAVALSDVFAIQIDNVIGEAADVVDLFSKENIGLTYLYSFLINGKGILIFRTDDSEKTEKVIILNKLDFIAEKDLTSLI